MKFVFRLKTRSSMFSVDWIKHIERKKGINFNLI